MLLAAGGGQAEAATTFGANLSTAPTNVVSINPVTTIARSFPLGQQASGGPTATISGVVVRWRIRSVANTNSTPGQSWTALFRLARGNRSVGIGAPVQVADIGGVQAFDTRLPVQAGDALGIDTPGGEGYVIGSAGSVDFYSPKLGATETRNPSTAAAQYYLAVNADIEADADGDGYGDETQDQCPTEARTHGPCPDGDGDGTVDVQDGCPSAAGPSSNGGCPLPDTVAPETTIIKQPKAKTRAKQARLEFTSSELSSTFECAIDGSVFAPCTSPDLFKRGRGTHVFQVRAKDDAGNIDQSPAMAEWKVLKKKKKKPKPKGGRGAVGSQPPTARFA